MSITPQEIKQRQAESIGVDESHTLGVLDKGFVRLIDWMGSDLSIVRAARVSYNADWRAGKDEGGDEKLIRSLMRRGHTSPFEAVTATFEVKAPIFVLRQWHRHRTQSYSEISARYTELDEGYFVPAIDTITLQDAKEKQARSTTPHPNAGSIRRSIELHNAACDRLYHELLGSGAPRELARVVLPVAAYSRMFATANLHNWFRFLRERLSPGAQHEIRVYATAILELLEQLAPTAVGAFRESLTKE